MILQPLPTVLNHFPPTTSGSWKKKPEVQENPGVLEGPDHSWWRWEGALELPGCKTMAQWDLWVHLYSVPWQQGGDTSRAPLGGLGAACDIRGPTALFGV